MANGFVLQEMTWPEFREALSTVKLAIIPTGATEQHGHGGTFGVDNGRADEFSKRLAGRLHPHAVAAPCVPFGFSPHHMNFPGTVTLNSEAFMRVNMDVMESLYRHGLRKFMFINGHGGNRECLDLVIHDFVDKHPDSWAAWVQITAMADDVRDGPEKESPLMGHACERELSQSLYLAPWSVRTEAVGLASLTEQAFDLHHRSIKFGRMYDEVTHDGGLGNSANATYELGERMIETALDRLSAWLRESVIGA